MKPQQSYIDKQLEWQQVRAAIGGKLKIDRLILGGCDFMVNPMYRVYPDMTVNGHTIPGNYNQVTKRMAAYWSRARYLNATRRTVDSLDGMIWSQQPVIEIPQALEYLKLRVFAQKATYETISIGRCGGLVDMPESDGKTTIAERNQGLNNPSMIFYKAEQIPFVRWENDTLLEVRLLETYEEQIEGSLDWEVKDQMRRLYLDDNGLYVVEIWRKDEVYSITEPRMNNQRMKEIPFQFFGSDDNSPEMTDSPIYDIASENLGHYMLSADNRDNLHYHSQGMTNVFTEVSDTYEFHQLNPHGMDCGAGGRNLFKQGDRVEILQIDSTGAIPAEMERVEQRMIMLGASLLQTNNTNETLGAKEIDTNAQTSTLKRIAWNVSEGIERMLTWCAGFLNVSGEIKYKLNTDYYTDSLTFQDLQVVMQQVQAGLAPKEILFDMMRKKGYTKLENDDIEEKIQDGNIGGVSEREAELLAQIESLQAQINGGE